MNKIIKKKKKGFTLIELIIVLAIMAIIAAIAIPNFTAIRDNSKNKSDVQSCVAIKRTVDMLVTDETIKPATTTKTLTVIPGTPTTVVATADADSGDVTILNTQLSSVTKPQGTIGGVATNSAAGKYSISIGTDGVVAVTTIAP